MTDVVEGEAVEIVEGTVAALAIREPGDALIRPAAGIDQIERAFKDYQALTATLLVPDDYQPIKQWNAETRQREVKLFPKRSAWRKLAVAFGVTFEIIARDKERDQSGRIISSDFVIRATAPNGRFVDGWGNCDRYERCCQQGCTKKHTHCAPDCDGTRHFNHAEHDIPATAETRAKNRAAADLFGMGQVSAEEVGSSGGDAPAAQPAPAPAAPTGPPKATPEQKKRLTQMLKDLVAAFPPAEGQKTWAEDMQAWMYERFGVQKSADLTVEQMDGLLEHLEATGLAQTQQVG